MRLLLTLFFLLLIVSPLYAKSSEKLVMWTSNEHIRDAVNSVAKNFEKDYGVKVDVVVLNKNVTARFQTAAMAGKGPDILVWAHDVVGELAVSGLIEPVSMPKSLGKQFIPVALDAFKYKGKTYGYPYDLEAIALIYNKKLVPNPPQTFEEIVEFAKNQKKANKKVYGFLYDFGKLFFSFPLISAQGGYIFKTENGKTNVHDVGLSNEGAVAGGELIYRLMKDGIIPASTDRSIAFNMMKKGELAMTIDGPWSMTELKKSGIDFGVMPIPAINGKHPRPFVGTHGFMIRRSSKQKMLAREFIENYLVTKNGIHTLYKLDPRGPSRMDVLQMLESDKHLQGFVRSAANGVPMPNVPQMSAVWSAMEAALQLIVGDKEKPASAFKNATAQILQAVNKE